MMASPNGPPLDPDYDPFAHREVRRPVTYFEALVHLVKAAIGTGILAMPQAFMRYGLLLGIISTGIIGIILIHCLHIILLARDKVVRNQVIGAVAETENVWLLHTSLPKLTANIECAYILCKKENIPVMTYSQTVVACFAYGPMKIRPYTKAARIVTDFYIVTYQMGVCCVYFVFIPETIKKLLDPYVVLPVYAYQLMILLPIIGSVCIRNLKALAPVSTIANILTIIALIIALYFLLTGKKSYDKPKMMGSAGGFSMAFGTTLFALTAVGTVMPIENNMKKPKLFGTKLGVLNVGMVFIVSLYIFIGAIGYIYCVSTCRDSITLDLPINTATNIMQVMFAFAIFGSYSLQFYPAIEVIWGTYTMPSLVKRGKTKLLPYEYALRVFLCLITCILGISVPRLGLFISLFGAFCLSALALMIPATMECIIKYPDYGPIKILLIKNVLIFILGIIVLIMGTTYTLLDIVKSFQ